MKAQVHAEDIRFETERRLFCKGSALVKLESLNWEESKIRQHDPKNVLWLKKIFEEDGCRSLKVGNHIPAIVDQHHLDTAIENAKQKELWNAGVLPSIYATIDSENGYPELEFPGGIICLHGFHRIQAGKALRPAEKWWIVDLYLSGISYEMRTILDEEYSNEDRPCDGQIYRKIREYQYLPLKADALVLPATRLSFEMRWWSRFNESRQKRLHSLFGHRLVATGFDALTKIPALFDAGMKVTTMNTVLATRCYEEIYHYLNHIFTAFVGFFNGIENRIQRLDKATVKAIERRAPAVSTSDSQELSIAIFNGTIFSGFSSQERSIIWGNILKFRGIIPSLSTFFEDMHLLEACVNCIRWLVTVTTDPTDRTNQTVFTALDSAFQSQEGTQCTQVVQTTETTFRLVKGSRTYCMKLGYLQIIAFAMKDYRHLPKQSVRKNLIEIARPKADSEVLQKGASFANQLGFSIPQIERLKGMEPLTFSEVEALVPVPKTAVVKIKRRSGMPHTDSFEEDRRHIFLHNLFQSDEEDKGITSFFILKSWFNAFFGTWAIPVPNTDSNMPPPKDEEVEKESVNLRRTQLRPLGPQHSARIMKDTKLGKPKNGVKHSSALKMEIDAPPDCTPRELIRFVEQDGNVTETLDQLLESNGVFQLWVDSGDPNSLVKQEVIELKDKGKRTCDKHKRHIAADECYHVATMAGNNNTLFVISEIKPEEDKHRGEDFDTSAMDGVELEREEIKPEKQAHLDLYGIPEHVPTQEVEDTSEPALHKTTLKVERAKAKRKTPYTRKDIKPQKQDRMDLYSFLKDVPTQKVKDDDQLALYNIPIYESALEIKPRDEESLSVIVQKRQEIKPEEQDRLDLYSPKHVPTQEIDDTSEPALHTTIKVERKKGKNETKTPYTHTDIKPQKQDQIDLCGIPEYIPTQEVKVEDDDQLALHNIPTYESTLEIKPRDKESPSVIVQKRQEIKPEEQDRLDLSSIPLYRPTKGVKLEDDTQLALHDIPAFQGQPSEEEVGSDCLLDIESENAANAQILAQNTVIIHVKKSFKNSHWVSKPAKDLPFDQLDSIVVPTEDPQNVVREKMLLYKEEGLLPHNGMGRKVNEEDCYAVAMEADDHTLYMIEEEY
ncbi:hypothetical protein VC83_07154 [Pseudogymnoascus destructans]|uniref:Uncharacterized protein n=1 Tax=Pseudogymnoascus destructans TaxID=655981 RepID=A0A177A343_9PEZI|nr:uncharacterized protein VC83_07154 [Pseudogymnoascus destructans]OAF56685.1 hypothetical protein VC83_07154 [Pseudogymnoascus destructans]